MACTIQFRCWFFTLACLLGWAFQLQGQSHVYSSLQQAFKARSSQPEKMRNTADIYLRENPNAPDDSLALATFLQISANYYQGRTDSLSHNAELFASHYDTLRQFALYGQLLNLLAQQHFRQNQLDSSKAFFSRALHLYTAAKDSSEMAGMYNNLSIVEAEKGNHQAELEYLILSYEINQALGYKAGMARGNINLSQCARSLKDIDMAESYARKGIKQARELDDKTSITYAQLALADVLFEQKQYDEALNVSFAVKRNALLPPADYYAYGNILKNIGDIQYALNRLDSAAFYYEQALAQQQQQHDLLHTARTRVHLAKTLNATQRSPEALLHLDTVTKQMGEQITPSLARLLHQIYYHVYDSLGQIENAYEHLQTFKSLEDTAQSARYRETVQSLKNQFRVSQTEAENALLAQENDLQRTELALKDEKLQRKNTWIAVGIIGTLVLLAIALLLWHFQQREKKARITMQHQQQALQKAHDEIKALLDTKNQIFSIIAHDLRGPIGNLEQLLNFVLEQPESDRGVLLKMARESAYTSFNLLENLLLWANQNRAKQYKEPVELSALCEQVIKLYQLSAKQKQVRLSSQIADDVVLHADKNMLHTTLRNLLHNAIKFSTTGGKVEVKVWQTTKAAFVSVQDEGVGMDEDTKAKILSQESMISTPGTQKEKGTGLGLKICQGYITQIGGSFNIDSTPGKGTTITCQIPL